ncbi:MAG: hypothetical protein HYX78_15995 [Armatimonadetes bacterium]|nr:hypothetical protein [Armatimonadota bacterium]
MNKRSQIAAAGALAAGAGLVLLDVLSKPRKEVLFLDREMPVPASHVLDLIKQVEREQELIPIISSVTVHSRTECDVHYTVRAFPPFPASVRYRKWWDESGPAVYWESECGTLGFHHIGQIRFTQEKGRSVAHLRSEHWITMPIFGRLTAPAISQVMRCELDTWLERLAGELKRGG